MNLYSNFTKSPQRKNELSCLNSRISGVCADKTTIATNKNPVDNVIEMWIKSTKTAHITLVINLQSFSYAQKHEYRQDATHFLLYINAPLHLASYIYLTFSNKNLIMITLILIIL